MKVTKANRLLAFTPISPSALSAPEGKGEAVLCALRARLVLMAVWLAATQRLSATLWCSEKFNAGV